MKVFVKQEVDPLQMLLETLCRLHCGIQIRDSLRILCTATIPLIHFEEEEVRQIAITRLNDTSCSEYAERLISNLNNKNFWRPATEDGEICDTEERDALIRKVKAEYKKSKKPHVFAAPCKPLTFTKRSKSKYLTEYASHLVNSELKEIGEPERKKISVVVIADENGEMRIKQKQNYKQGKPEKWQEQGPQQQQQKLDAEEILKDIGWNDTMMNIELFYKEQCNRHFKDKAHQKRVGDTWTAFYRRLRIRKAEAENMERRRQERLRCDAKMDHSGLEAFKIPRLSQRRDCFVK